MIYAVPRKIGTGPKTSSYRLFPYWLQTLLDTSIFNTMRLRKDGCHFINKILILIFLYKRSFCSKSLNDIMMSGMASQINGISIVCSTICCGADQRKHQSSASLAFVREIRW